MIVKLYIFILYAMIFQSFCLEESKELLNSKITYFGKELKPSTLQRFRRQIWNWKSSYEARDMVIENAIIIIKEWSGRVIIKGSIECGTLINATYSWPKQIIFKNYHINNLTVRYLSLNPSILNIEAGKYQASTIKKAGGRNLKFQNNYIISGNLEGGIVDSLDKTNLNDMCLWNNLSLYATIETLRGDDDAVNLRDIFSAAINSGGRLHKPQLRVIDLGNSTCTPQIKHGFPPPLMPKKCPYRHGEMLWVNREWKCPTYSPFYRRYCPCHPNHTKLANCGNYFSMLIACNLKDKLSYPPITRYKCPTLTTITCTLPTITSSTKKCCYKTTKCRMAPCFCFATSRVLAQMPACQHCGLPQKPCVKQCTCTCRFIPFTPKSTMFKSITCLKPNKLCSALAKCFCTRSHYCIRKKPMCG